MINLEKGQKVSLDKGMQFAKAGLGWDVNGYDNGADFDLDASVFMLGANGKLTSDDDFVFYNHARHSSNSVIYSGDNRTGDGAGDDESILIDFSKIPANIERLVFVVTIHKAAERKQNFGMVSNAYIRLLSLNAIDDANGKEELRFDLSEDYSTETSMIVAEIYRHNGEWKFAAKGEGSKDELQDLLNKYSA